MLPTNGALRFDIGSSGQQVRSVLTACNHVLGLTRTLQIHIAFGSNDRSSRHPCFKIASSEDLLALRQRIWDHHKKADEAAPQEADEPGEASSGKP